MEDQVNRLVDKVWARLQETPSHRLIIAIGGIPGSGKTTLSKAVAAGLNRRHRTQNPAAADAADATIAVSVPMDGFHLTRAQLSAMPDPAAAHARRGAAFTFDAPAFLALLRALRAADHDDAAAVVLAPAFDHAVADPVPGAIAVSPAHRAVLVEGNYVLLDRHPWRAAAALADERWFVDVPFARARARLVRRHLAAGIVRDSVEAAQRADENDLVNGQEIVRLRLPVDEVVVSSDDAAWDQP